MAVREESIAQNDLGNLTNRCFALCFVDLEHWRFILFVCFNFFCFERRGEVILWFALVCICFHNSTLIISKSSIVHKGFQGLEALYMLPWSWLYVWSGCMMILCACCVWKPPLLCSLSLCLKFWCLSLFNFLYNNDHVVILVFLT